MASLSSLIIALPSQSLLTASEHSLDQIFTAWYELAKSHAKAELSPSDMVQATHNLLLSLPASHNLSSVAGNSLHGDAYLSEVLSVIKKVCTIFETKPKFMPLLADGALLTALAQAVVPWCLAIVRGHSGHQFEASRRADALDIMERSLKLEQQGVDMGAAAGQTAARLPSQVIPADIANWLCDSSQDFIVRHRLKGLLKAASGCNDKLRAEMLRLLAQRGSDSESWSLLWDLGAAGEPTVLRALQQRMERARTAEGGLHGTGSSSGSDGFALRESVGIAGASSSASAYHIDGTIAHRTAGQPVFIPVDAAVEAARLSAGNTVQESSSSSSNPLFDFSSGKSRSSVGGRLAASSSLEHCKNVSFSRPSTLERELLLSLSDHMVNTLSSSSSSAAAGAGGGGVSASAGAVGSTAFIGAGALAAAGSDIPTKGTVVLPPMSAVAGALPPAAGSALGRESAEMDGALQLLRAADSFCFHASSSVTGAGAGSVLAAHSLPGFAFSETGEALERADEWLSCMR